MAEKSEEKVEQAEGPKIKLAANPTPPDEIFVDGVAGILARPGLVKLDCYRVVGIDRSDNAEVRSISHRLVLPAVAIPEMVRLFQNMAKAGRQASEGAEAAGAKDAASADTKTKN